MMIEGFGDFLSNDEMLYAIEKGHEVGWCRFTPVYASTE
jgi:hypothetical protein